MSAPDSQVKAGFQAAGTLLLAAAFICSMEQLTVFSWLKTTGPPALYTAASPTYGKRLSDLKDFRYLINNDVCGSDPVRILVATLADPHRPDIRQTLRRALPTSVLGPLHVRRIFLLADASVATEQQSDVVSQEVLLAEDAIYHDLVQGSFLDTYINLTYKSMMAMDWTLTYCPQAEVIMKADEDTAFDIYRLLNIPRLFNQTDLLMGHLFMNSIPIRDVTGPYSKWRVSEEEWPRDLYPPYVAGWLYFLSPGVARRILDRALQVPYYWIEDVYLTGMLAEQIGVHPQRLNQQYANSKNNSLCKRQLMGGQDFSITEQSRRPVYWSNRTIVTNLKDTILLESMFRLYEYCYHYPCVRKKNLSKYAC